MKLEKEICVKVNCSYDELHKQLSNENFILKEEYVLNDIYMLQTDIDKSTLSNLDILKKCVLIREIEGIKKVLLYKYKEFADNGDILKQGKVECPIDDIEAGEKFINMIGYERLIVIRDKCIVYANDVTELVVQLVNNKYIFIEMENKPEFIEKEYTNIEDMKKELFSYNIDIDKNNIFVKKAEIILTEIK